jgi:hypothetical protein
MVGDGGTYKVPVTINAQLTLTVDSGAADVYIPADVVMTLWRTVSNRSGMVFWISNKARERCCCLTANLSARPAGLQAG